MPRETGHANSQPYPSHDALLMSHTTNLCLYTASRSYSWTITDFLKKSANCWPRAGFLWYLTVAPERLWKWEAPVRSESGGVAPIRRKAPGKLFLVVPLHFLALKVQLVVSVSAFVMVSTIWSVSCSLFSYWRCPPCPMESAALISYNHQLQLAVHKYVEVRDKNLTQYYSLPSVVNYNIRM